MNHLHVALCSVRADRIHTYTSVTLSHARQGVRLTTDLVAGQYAAPTYANYGDGYCSDSTLLGSNSNPTDFFTSLLSKEYVSQVMLAPHVSLLHPVT